MSDEAAKRKNPVFLPRENKRDRGVSRHMVSSGHFHGNRHLNAHKEEMRKLIDRMREQVYL